MIGNGKIEYSAETEKIIKAMTKDEVEAFLDLCTVRVCAEQAREPRGDIIPIMNKVITDQASKFVSGKKEESEKQAARAGREEDMAKRRSATGQFASREPTSSPVVEDASTILELLIKKKMDGNPSLSYLEASTQVQKENMELSRRIVAELDEMRREHKTRAGF
jgi:hypothetical protein